MNNKFKIDYNDKMNVVYASSKDKHADKYTVYRIIALKDFGLVKKGEKGGYIEKESNLSETGDCWIHTDSYACGNSEILGNAIVYGKSKIVDSLISDFAKVYTTTAVNSTIIDNAIVANCMLEDILSANNTTLRHCILKHTLMAGSPYLENIIDLKDNNTIIGGNAFVTQNSDYITISFPIFRGSLHTMFTAYKTKNKKIEISCDMFTCRIEDLAETVYRTLKDVITEKDKNNITALENFVIAALGEEEE
jgi:hypothetical protein